MKKSVSFVLLATILLQSCVAYQKTSVSLNEAENKGKVKVTTTLGDESEYDNIDFRNNGYFGTYAHGEISLDSAQISSIYLQDIMKSKHQTIITIVSVVIVIPILLIGIGFYNLNITGW